VTVLAQGCGGDLADVGRERLTAAAVQMLHEQASVSGESPEGPAVAPGTGVRVVSTS
jgi:hypothetical protein